MRNKKLIILFILYLLIPSILSSKNKSYFRSAVEHLNKKRINLAIKEFKLDLKNNPENINSHCGLAIAYIRKKNYNLAKETLESALKSKLENALLFYLLGKIYEHKKENKNAIQCFEKALSLTTDKKFKEKIRMKLNKIK